MKLRHQIAILLGLPLVIQLCFGGILLDTLAKVDSAGRREVLSKEIIAACQDVRSSLVQYMSLIVVRAMLNPRATARARENVRKVVTEKLDDLTALLKNDAGAQPLVKDYRERLQHFQDVIGDAGMAFEDAEPEVFMTTYIQEAEYFEELVVAYDKVTKTEGQLVARYRPVGKDLNPESLSARENLRNLMIYAGIADMLIVMILAAIFGQKTLRRLAVLMKNIELFSAGNPELEALAGNDELSEVDASFRKMADARTKAEEIRRSLVATVSHDIRSPLTSVGLNLSMILELHGDSLIPKVHEKIKKTDGEIQRLVRLADGLLEIEKIESNRIDLERQWIIVTDLWEPARYAVSGIAEAKNVSLQLSIDDEEVDVYVDSDRIIQVLVNLMSNAVKFSPTGSNVTLKVSLTEDESLWEVIDEGPGVAREDEARLFQRFSQLDQSMETKKVGSGLGLYITRMLVEAHGGKVGYRKVEAGGSCFWFNIDAPRSAIETE